ncbi:MAG: hypothetical protein KGJ49_01860 [Alphaproteobacteria bacterium]|nr:hypothetical protein [Alphaproteobacteria bacterium]
MNIKGSKGSLDDAASDFHKAVDQMRPLLRSLMKQEPISLGEASSFPTLPGVYLITDSSGHLYTGRCKSIRQRMRNHGGNSPESSTFAFRLACEKLGRKATYKKGESRKALASNPNFKTAFLENVERIRKMNVRFVVIEDDITQHLFEVYVHLALHTPHNTFGTH